MRVNKNLNNYYEYYENEYVGDMEVSHILITIDANNNSSEDEKKEAEEKALNTAKEVIKALDKGEKFEDLAKKYSKDEDTSKKGGSLGKINVGDYTSEVVDAAKELKVGTYTTTPVKSSYGYHIVYLKSQDKKPELNDDVTNKIKTIVGNEIAQEPNFYVKALKALREKNEMKFKDTTLEKEFNKYYGIIEDFRYTLTEVQGKTVKYYRLRLPMGKGRRNYMSIYYIIMQQFF